MHATCILASWYAFSARVCRYFEESLNYELPHKEGMKARTSNARTRTDMRHTDTWARTRKRACTHKPSSKQTNKHTRARTHLRTHARGQRARGVASWASAGRCAAAPHGAHSRAAALAVVPSLRGLGPPPARA